MDDIISNHLDAAMLHEKIGEHHHRAAIHHAVGNTQEEMEHTQKAHELLTKAIELTERTYNDLLKSTLAEKKKEHEETTHI